jgi:hypothetical protein
MKMVARENNKNLGQYYKPLSARVLEGDFYFFNGRIK